MLSSFTLPAIPVDGQVVERARGLNANAILRVVLADSKSEFDAVAFWQDTDATRIERNCGDSAEYLKEGILRVMALAQKLQRNLAICRETCTGKVTMRDTMISACATLESVGASQVDLTALEAAFCNEIALLQQAVCVHEMLLAQALTALDEMSERMFDLYPPASGRCINKAGFTVQ